MLLHDCNPLSFIPHVPYARSVRRVSANGAHVVIFGLSVASNFIICAQHVNPLSFMPHDPDAYKILRVVAKGLQIVIFSL